MTTAPPLDLAAVRARRQVTWASGDLAQVTTHVAPAAERLMDERDLAALAVTWNRLGQPGPIGVPATYLASLGVRR